MAERAAHLVDHVLPDVAVRQWVLSLPHRIRYLLAWAPRAGARVRRCGDPPEEVEPSTLGRCHARQHGFDLHAGIVVRAGQRDRLERLCRYALRPPVAQDRLRQAADGEVWLALRRRWADGTTHLRFDPIELLERLAALTPRPRVNLILYLGVLAPRAGWRSEVVEYAPSGTCARWPWPKRCDLTTVTGRTPSRVDRARSSGPS